MNTFSIIQQLESDNSRLAKEAILTKNKDNSGQFLPSMQFTENANSLRMYQAKKQRPYMNQRTGMSNSRTSPYSVFFNKRGRS
jgi:hypothetical protein